MDPVLLQPVFECRSGPGQRLNKFWPPDRGDHDAVGSDTVWLVVDTEERQSTVKNGPYAGMTLRQVMQKRGRELVGPTYDKQAGFPLMLRIIDSVEATPLQVQPSTPGLPTANSKFWYLLDREGGEGGVGAGIRRRATRMQVMEHLNDQKLRQLIESFPAKRGDAFLIPPGVVHYLGAGMLALELQDGNKLPYVVSYWGEKEQVPAEQTEALEAVQFENRHCWRIAGDSARPAYTRKIPLVKHFPEFIVDEVRLQDYSAERTNNLSFHLLCGIEGTFDVRSRSQTTHLEVGPGEVVCIPANYGDYFVYADKGQARFLRILLMTESEPGVKERAATK